MALKKRPGSGQMIGAPVPGPGGRQIYGCGGQNRFGIPFWLVGEFTTHSRTYFSGDWDVQWGYDLAFDPWPYFLYIYKNHADLYT